MALDATSFRMTMSIVIPANGKNLLFAASGKKNGAPSLSRFCDKEPALSAVEGWDTQLSTPCHLGSRWFTERFHRNALVTHFQHGQVFCTARQLKDYAVTRCRLHQRAPQR